MTPEEEGNVMRAALTEPQLELLGVHSKSMNRKYLKSCLYVCQLNVPFCLMSRSEGIKFADLL